jgi:hypothetical protein
MPDNNENKFQISRIGDSEQGNFCSGLASINNFYWVILRKWLAVFQCILDLFTFSNIPE